MSRWRMVLLLAGVVAQIGTAADRDSASLLLRVREKVRENTRDLPRFVCRQNIQRQAYTPIKRRLHGCGTLAELTPPADGPTPQPAGANGPLGFKTAVTDRAHLDVMIAKRAELFSWPGGGRFETAEPTDLLGGGFAGTGDFAGFVSDVFLNPGTTFEYLGRCDSASCVRYRYDVPIGVSRYVLQTAADRVTVAFHGTLEIDPQTANLLSMSVIPTGIPKQLRGACDLRTRMTYARTTAKASEFMIPQSVSKEFLAVDDSYFVDRMSYTDCRQYTAESSLTFGADGTNSPEARTATPPALPRPGTELKLRLRSSIDSDVNWGGDRLEAALAHAVKATDGSTIPAGTVIRGHLAEVEKSFIPHPGVRLAIRFDSIVLNGVPIALAMVPENTQDLRGRGIFEFSKQHVILDGRFTSKWRVR